LEGSIVEAKLREYEFRTDNIELDIKILLIGSEGAGKSTLLGVLVTGQSDNGQGGSRITVERHKHAILNGYTSSINHGILGFDNKGKITNINDLQLLSQ
jgi:elongation factor 1-alpha